MEKSFRIENVLLDLRSPELTSFSVGIFHQRRRAWELTKGMVLESRAPPIHCDTIEPTSSIVRNAVFDAASVIDPAGGQEAYKVMVRWCINLRAGDGLASHGDRSVSWETGTADNKSFRI